MWIVRSFLSALLFSSFLMGEENSKLSENNKLSGVCLVAPPRKFPADPMPALTEIGAGWVAVVPYAFTRSGEPAVHYNHRRQWWGESPEGARKTIQLAQDAGLKVMLKPHVWVRGAWIGALDFPSEKEWSAWEADYEEYLLTYAKIAEEMGVQILCIGTEIKKSVVPREAFWRALIKKVKKEYSGKLTYAANWDEYAQVPFWDALDFIGVDAYFPLIQEKTPSVTELKKAWIPTVEKLEAFSKEKGKPILFTEYGYLSLDGSAYKTWELEKKRATTTVNEQAQVNCLEALYQSFDEKEWWAGGFLWKWYPNMDKGNGHSAQYNAGDYTPQGKPSSQTLKRWFQRSVTE